MSILCGSIPEENTERESFELLHEMFSGKLTDIFYFWDFLSTLLWVKVPFIAFVVFDLSALLRFYVKSASVRLCIRSSRSSCWIGLVVWLALVA